MFFFKTFGDWLKHEREKAGLSQDDVVRNAKRAGLDISKSTISLYERNAITTPKLASIDALAVGIGIDKQEARNAYSSITISKPLKQEEGAEIIPLDRGISLVFDGKTSKLDLKQRDTLVKMLKLVISGVKSGLKK